MKPTCFAERYCEEHGLPLDRFAEVVVRRALYPHAWLLRPVLTFLNPQHFAADYDFVHAVGRIRRAREFAAEAGDFTYHPANVGFLRRRLRLRVSSKRLRKLVRSTLHGVQPRDDNDDVGTTSPFPTTRSGAELA